jgi:hypothetical protein
VRVFRFDSPTGPEPGNYFETRYWSPINSPGFGGDGASTHIIHHAIDVTGEDQGREREGIDESNPY